MQEVPQQETVDAKNIKVSVLVTTYNQEEYIAQTVNSALDQETDFDYEIVIGDDASADRTPQILLELQKAHPEKIRLLLHEKNLGWKGKYNFLSALKECRGEYVAVLDGDDYWTSPLKLQKQIDFLESHPDCFLCFHNVLGLNLDAPHESKPMCYEDQKEISTLADIAAGNFMVPCAVMFRNSLGEFPESFYNLMAADWMIYVMCGERGNLGYINEVLATYRIHGAGAWSKLNFIQRIKEHIKTYEAIDAYLKFQYSPIISEKISALRVTLSQQYKQHARTCLDKYHSLTREGQFLKALPLLIEATRSAPSQVFRPRRLAAVLKNGLAAIIYSNNKAQS